MRRVFLENLPTTNHNGGSIDWKNSIGYKIKFIYDDIEGELEIVCYTSKNQELDIIYNDNNFKIRTGNLKECKITKLINKRTKGFKIEIGTNFKDSKRDLIIIDREYRKNKRGQNRKWYKYHCNRCNWDEGWLEESELFNGTGCSCCSNRTPVLGINTIYDTDKWMIPIVGEEFAKTHVHCCSNKIYPICPDCGKTKHSLMKISTIYEKGKVNCICEDNISYPEKLMISLLEKVLNNNFIYQLSKSTFEWCSQYRYDFYFELNNEKYIIETHGDQHYRDKTRFKMSLEEVQKNDSIKRDLALNNNIKEENYIVIDCRKSELEFIKNNILNSRLNELFDLNSVDWKEINKNSQKNLFKIISLYWHLHNNINNEKLTTTDLIKEFNLGGTIIRKALKLGNEFEWCEYEGEEEIKKILNKNANIIRKKLSKPVEIFKNGISMGVFPSCAELERQSEKLFGVKLDNSQISCVCNINSKRHRDSYKGFNFRYV